MTDGDDEPELWVLDGEDAAELGGGARDPDGDGDDDAAALRARVETDLASTLTSEDVAGDDWADTAWLDALAPRLGTRATGSPDTRDDAATPQAAEDDDAVGHVAGPPPIDEGWAVDDPAPTDGPDIDDVADATAPPSTGGDDRRVVTSADEFAGLVDPITLDDTAAGSSMSADDDAEAAEDEPVPATNGSRPSRQRRRTTKSGDEVSEFLRELSRLALDED